MIINTAKEVDTFVRALCLIVEILSNMDFSDCDVAQEFLNSMKMERFTADLHDSTIIAYFDNHLPIRFTIENEVGSNGGFGLHVSSRILQTYVEVDPETKEDLPKQTKCDIGHILDWFTKKNHGVL